MRESLIFFLLFFCHSILAQDIHLRLNQLGYLPEESKMVMVLSKQPLSGAMEIQNIEHPNIRTQLKAENIPTGKWGEFAYQYRLDFSKIRQIGDYQIRWKGQNLGKVKIAKTPYRGYQEDLLAFMRQQRCGYNPYFDVVCHQGDGRLFFAPIPDSSFYDFSGGWHDAGDQLKYLITSSNATARLLLAYETAPEQFADLSNAYGQQQANGIPDILDEARWGLEWILKLHPHPDWLIHQIADDRDHAGFKFPHQDNAQYGWGENSYRPAYFATGTPQGLSKYKSKATGVANLAGRSAAALAIAARIWQQNGLDDAFAQRCQQAAKTLFSLGLKKEGFQQGNSFLAPYRYNEDTWTDDMEWGAAELFKLTAESFYLEKAIHYAYQTKDSGWMAQDTMDHYQKYPFMNMGHFSLHSVAPDTVKKDLETWYRQNIEKVLARGQSNAFEFGVPFIWCSNNLLVNFITQVLLYEKMTDDLLYHDQMLLHRDWLFGRNPWGSTMFTGIPRDGESPFDVHIPPRALLQETPAGGLVDGPIYKAIFKKLIGLTLVEPDEFAAFQNDFVVYHDDIGDYSSNEPTMDGTADAIFLWSLWLQPKN